MAVLGAVLGLIDRKIVSHKAVYTAVLNQE